MSKRRKRPVFECSQCGELVPISSLSKQAIRASGAQSAAGAVLCLNPEELVCQDCASLEADLLDMIDGECLGRSVRERFEFSGIYVDPARLQAYRLNY